MPLFFVQTEHRYWSLGQTPLAAPRARYRQLYLPADLATYPQLAYPAAYQRGPGWDCWYGSGIGVGTRFRMGDGMVAGHEAAG